MNAHIRTLKPAGMPAGMDPRIWRKSIETRLNDLLDRAMSLITALDVMEADSCDFEDGGDDEPSLGWCTGYGPGNTLDLEAVDEDGGDINDEPEGDDERELDPADYDCPGPIEGGQGI